MSRQTEFLIKLQALMSEYDVSIDAGYEGDTHGIHSEHICISHRPEKGSFREEEWLRIDYQTYLTVDDLSKHTGVKL